MTHTFWLFCDKRPVINDKRFCHSSLLSAVCKYFHAGGARAALKIAMFLHFQDPRMTENGLFTAFFARQR